MPYSVMAYEISALNASLLSCMQVRLWVPSSICASSTTSRILSIGRKQARNDTNDSKRADEFDQLRIALECIYVHKLRKVVLPNR